MQSILVEILGIMLEVIRGDTLKSHNHPVAVWHADDNNKGGYLTGCDNTFGSLLGDEYNPNNITPYGGTETRPKNAYMYDIIKY